MLFSASRKRYVLRSPAVVSSHSCDIGRERNENTDTQRKTAHGAGMFFVRRSVRPFRMDRLCERTPDRLRDDSRHGRPAAVGPAERGADRGELWDGRGHDVLPAGGHRRWGDGTQDRDRGKPAAPPAAKIPGRAGRLLAESAHDRCGAVPAVSALYPPAFYKRRLHPRGLVDASPDAPAPAADRPYRRGHPPGGHEALYQAGDKVRQLLLKSRRGLYQRAQGDHRGLRDHPRGQGGGRIPGPLRRRGQVPPAGLVQK